MSCPCVVAVPCPHVVSGLWHILTLSWIYKKKYRKHYKKKTIAIYNVLKKIIKIILEKTYKKTSFLEFYVFILVWDNVND